MQVKGIKLFIMFIFSPLLYSLFAIFMVFIIQKAFDISDEKQTENFHCKNQCEIFLRFSLCFNKKTALNTLFSLEIKNNVC